LAGDRLADGVYQPIGIVQVDESHKWGHSQVLGLDLCWEDGWLRWYDPAARRYLRTLDEEAEERIAAEEERDAERRGRLMVEEERDAAQERIRELEAEMRRLQG
jgi:hypothetical protein